MLHTQGNNVQEADKEGRPVNMAAILKGWHASTECHAHQTLQVVAIVSLDATQLGAQGAPARIQARAGSSGAS